jgi:hypothetical protein
MRKRVMRTARKTIRSMHPTKWKFLKNRNKVNKVREDNDPNDSNHPNDHHEGAGKEN